MPTVTLSKKTLLELLGRKISDEQLADRISMLGTEFEGIEGDEIHVEIFPNRPDLLSEQGLARALSSFMGIRKGLRKYTVKKSNVKVIIDKSVKTIRPYTACAVVKNLKLTDEKIKEIIQIQEKLHITYGRNRRKAAIGIYPLEHIKPPIYYKALNPEEIKFKPLDLNKDLTGNQILAIHPTGREYGYLLEGKDKFPVFLDSKMQIMSMPPIINSNTVGKITIVTRDVFIECSGFDFEYLHTCLNMVVTALADMGGEIQSVELSYPEKKYITPNLDGREMKIDITYLNSILGTVFSESELKKQLELMGYDYKNKKVIIPGYRADVLHPIDIVEDVAIAYGYENFKGHFTKIATSSAEKPLEIFKSKIREIAIGNNLIEVKNYHLTSRDKQAKLMNISLELVELLNSVTKDYDILRHWITPSLLETLQYNKHHDYPQNIFEIGTSFKFNPNSETGVSEHEMFAVALCGNDANFTKIKKILDTFMEALNITYDIVETQHDSFIKGRVGRIVVNNEKIAYIGELHPQILLNWGIEMPVAILELNLTDLIRISNFGFEEEITHQTEEKPVQRFASKPMPKSAHKSSSSHVSKEKKSKTKPKSKSHPKPKSKSKSTNKKKR